MKKIVLLMILGLLAGSLCAQFRCKDEICFGNVASEQKHAFRNTYSEVIRGESGELARRLLPGEVSDYRGGTMAFQMKVDSVKQNYFTVRCWGSDAGRSMVLLFSEGKQVGYRHLGDVDLLWLGNGEAPLRGRYLYITLPLPLKHTQGKESVELELRSYGEIWGYGETFERYQKNMTEPTLGFYKGYTHTAPCFVPARSEKQGKVEVAAIRPEPGPEVLEELKARVNRELTAKIDDQRPLGQLDMWFLADAYSVKWTVAYHNPRVVSRILASMDSFYYRYEQDSKLVYQDQSVYNCEWLTIGPMARAIRMLWPCLQMELEKDFPDGAGKMVSRKMAYSKMLQAALDYSTTHRRQYTNQSMIIDLFMYDCNRALLLVDPQHALPEYQTLRYLYESVGLAPWLGAETPKGSARPLGDNYWQLTDKGLTKELGFVGYYGEVLDWVVDIYRSTCLDGKPGTGDPKIREQLLKMAMARSYFRYPAADQDGYKAMLAEAVVGWRDAGHYPGNVIYGDRGAAWDATPLMTAAITLDPCALGAAQQMIADNQFFQMVQDKLAVKGIRGTKSLLHIPDEYDLVMAQPQSDYHLPMDPSMPDFVFSDEEDGVIAVKHGKDILYASLYWRAGNAVNNLAKVHYITPDFDQVANICIESEYTPSGMVYVRPNWVNLGFASWREWYKGIESAHAGDSLPIARIPEGIKFKPGDENVYAGKADFYRMNYGKYLVGMNMTLDKTFELLIPGDAKKVVNLTGGNQMVKSRQLSVGPRSTVVLYVE